MENAGKMVLLDKLLPKLQSRNSRVLIFSQVGARAAGARAGAGMGGCKLLHGVCHLPPLGVYAYSSPHHPWLCSNHHRHCLVTADDPHDRHPGGLLPVPRLRLLPHRWQHLGRGPRVAGGC